MGWTITTKFTTGAAAPAAGGPYEWRARGSNAPKIVHAEATFNNSYNQNGETLTPSDFQLSDIYDFYAEDIDTGCQFQLDLTNAKVKAGVIGSGGRFAELANGAYILNGLKCRLWVFGVPM